MISSKSLLFILKLTIFFLFLSLFSISYAYDVNDKLSLETSLTGVYQYGDIKTKDADNTGKGSITFDLGINFHPTDNNEFYLLMSYSAGNALNTTLPFSLSTYADDLEDNLKDINGRNRNYLLEAWYKHRFKLSENIYIGFTGGIIDATRYIDDNNFANCEITQFMNEAFVNNTIANLPSYDIGGVTEIEYSDFTFKAIIMNSKNEFDKNYNYYAMQFGYKLNSPLGEGNYRFYIFTSSKDFQNWNESSLESLKGLGLSFDQKINDILGLFIRTGWQDDNVIINHNSLYSFGANINGKLWARNCDEAGIGYAYLDGVDKSNIDNTNIFETYIRFKLTNYSDLTLDFQYINDKLKKEKDNEGIVYGIRISAYF